MKVIIAGSRTINSLKVIYEAVEESGFEITRVVCGMAKGVDILGKQWAELNDIPVSRFPAKWEEEGKVAGILRNKAMADYAEALIAIWDGKSVGTAHMIKEMEKKNKPVFIKRLQ